MADYRDWAGRPDNDGDPARRIMANKVRRNERRRAEEFLKPVEQAERVLLRAAGEPAYGKCPACGAPDVELVLRNGRESCGACPWERGEELPEPDPAELARVLHVPLEQVTAVLDSAGIREAAAI